MTFVPRRCRVASHVGSVRKRLAAKLSAAFKQQHGLDFRVDPERLRPAQGAYRTDVRQDCGRWEGFGEIKHPETGTWMNATLDSWDTMSNCLKGLVIQRDRGMAFDVHAKGEIEP